MFWVFTIVGGGLLWNAVDGVAGFFLATDAMVEVFTLACGFVLFEIMGAGLVAGTKQLGPHAYGLVESQLAAVCLVIAAAATAFVWKTKPKGAVAVVIIGAVYAVAHFKLWQWWIPNVILGSNPDESGPYLNAMGLPESTSTTAPIRDNFNQVALHGQAVTMAIVAIIVGVVITSIFRAAGVGKRSSGRATA